MTHSLDEPSMASRGPDLPRDGEPSCDSNVIVFPGPRFRRPAWMPTAWAADAGWRATAIHEAGHAVVADAAGARVESVELASDVNQPFRGRVRRSDNVDLIANMRIAVAGAAAEWCSQPRSSNDRRGAATAWVFAKFISRPCSDMTAFLQHAAEHHGNGFEPHAYVRLFDGAVVDAVAILTERWEAVVAVADELLYRGYLTHAEVVALLDGGGPKFVA